MNRGFVQIPILVTILACIAVLGGAGYFVYEAVQKTSIQIEKPVAEQVAKDLITETAVASPVETEEMARKKQRDTDRNKCIADAQEEYTKFELQNPECVGNLGTRCLSRMPRVQENIDRCYFRFPNN